MARGGLESVTESEVRTMIGHFNVYSIPVRGLEKCVAFYRAKLGLKLRNKENDIAYFEDPEGNLWEISTFLNK
jgi:catechol 2,3-dioxygenase-like lactoylglutathione lyase family enzyme